MTRVLFHDPYLEMLGGGEKFLLTILEEVAQAGEHEVTMLSPARPDLVQWERLNIHVDTRKLRWRAANQLSITPLTVGADLFVTLTNHFPPLSLAKRSAAIVQFPFAQLSDGGRPVATLRAAERALRLRTYQRVICYSEYVATEIRARLNVPHPVVIAPPVDLPVGPQVRAKERKVIAVGRFFPAADANNKKHALLIDAWRRLETFPEARGWELHLVGGVHKDDASLEHLERLRERASGLAVHFHPNAEAGQLQSLYRNSSLFWHAAGFGETLAERHEHFGTTTVEAMAYGCVPIVIGLGGQLEIVSDGLNGRLWHSADQLVAITRELIADAPQAGRLRREAMSSSSRYGKDSFLHRIRETILRPAGLCEA
jgi:glycosyltransferase involved in cell wall biosynthesis